MTVLDVHPPGYALAARTVGGEIATTAVDTAGTLGYSLAGCAGMAGSDDVGSPWGSAYDAAAEAAMSATTDAANAMFCVAALLEQSGINYAGAEAACVPGETAAQSESRWANSSAPAARPLPSAVGMGVPQPGGWSLLQHAIGRVWPNGHQDGLRTAGAAWRAAADGLEFVLPHLDTAITEVMVQRAPEVADATTILYSVRARLVELAGRHRDLGAACEAYAHRLDEAHSAIMRECVEFVDITVAAETAGGLLSVVTVGLSEVAANSAVAIAAVRIGRTIADLIDILASSVVAIAAELDAATLGFATVERELAPVLARRVEQAAIVRPGVAGQLGPVVGTSPTDLVLTRLTRSYGPTKVLSHVDDPRLFDARTLRGISMADVQARIPANWRVRASAKGGGVVFEDPVRLGRQIRVMPGYPAGARPGAINHGPYAVVTQNGRPAVKIALKGNPTLK